MKTRLSVAMISFISLFSVASHAQCLKPEYAPQVYQVLGSDGDVRIHYKEPKTPADLVILTGIGFGALGGISAGGGESGAIVGGVIGAIPGAVYGISNQIERKREERKFILWSLIDQTTRNSTPENALLIQEIEYNKKMMESLVAERVAELEIQLLSPISLDEISATARRLNETQAACTVKKDGTRKVLKPKKLAALIVDEILGIKK